MPLELEREPPRTHGRCLSQVDRNPAQRQAALADRRHRTAKPQSKLADLPSRCCGAGQYGGGERRSGLVDALPRVADQPEWISKPGADVADFLAVAADHAGDRARERRLGLLQALAELAHRRDDHLGRRSRGWSANVGHEIGDRVVDFVAYGRDDRNRRAMDCAGDDFLIERPQVFERAAAAADDYYFGAAVAIQVLDRVRDIGRRSRPLNPGGPDYQMEIRKAREDNRQDVADRRGAQRRDDPDGARQEREWALARWIEKSVGLKALLELLESPRSNRDRR